MDLLAYGVCRLGESSRREAIRTSGPTTLSFTPMNKEKTKEMVLWSMRILLQHMLLADFTTVPLLFLNFLMDCVISSVSISDYFPLYQIMT